MVQDLLKFLRPFSPKAKQKDKCECDCKQRPSTSRTIHFADRLSSTSRTSTMFCHPPARTTGHYRGLSASVVLEPRKLPKSVIDPIKRFIGRPSTPLQHIFRDPSVLPRGGPPSISQQRPIYAGNIHASCETFVHHIDGDEGTEEGEEGSDCTEDVAVVGMAPERVRTRDSEVHNIARLRSLSAAAAAAASSGADCSSLDPDDDDNKASRKKTGGRDSRDAGRWIKVCRVSPSLRERAVFEELRCRRTTPVSKADVMTHLAAFSSIGNDTTISTSTTTTTTAEKDDRTWTRSTGMRVDGGHRPLSLHQERFGSAARAEMWEMDPFTGLIYVVQWRPRDEVPHDPCKSGLDRRAVRMGEVVRDGKATTMTRTTKGRRDERIEADCSARATWRESDPSHGPLSSLPPPPPPPQQQRPAPPMRLARAQRAKASALQSGAFVARRVLQAEKHETAEVEVELEDDSIHVGEISTIRLVR